MLWGTGEDWVVGPDGLNNCFGLDLGFHTHALLNPRCCPILIMNSGSPCVSPIHLHVIMYQPV